MSLLLRDLNQRGLAGGAIVFTMAAFSAAIGGGVLVAALQDRIGFPRQVALGAYGLFWLLCMLFTWRYLYRARQTWPEAVESTSLFHIFQFVTIGICVLYAAFSGGLHSPTYRWFGFIIEITVVAFYFSYVFLGLTLRYRMPRSAAPGFLLALAALWWSGQNLPGL